MPATPRFKIYDHGKYEAAVKHAESAAMLVACLGEGSDIRDGHAVRDIVWREGAERFSAAESYDGVAEVIHRRVSGDLAGANAWIETNFGPPTKPAPAPTYESRVDLSNRVIADLGTIAMIAQATDDPSPA